MPILRVFIVALALTMLFPTGVLASKEGILSLGTFQLSSPGTDESGPVVVSGARKGEVALVFCVQAFGRTRCLSKEQLNQVGGSPINGVQISYEAGYRETGGRTIYIVFSKGFVSGRDEGKLIMVPEFGPIATTHAPRN